MNADQPRPHKPVTLAPVDFEPLAGGVDPARVSEAAHLSAQALVHHGRTSDDPVVTERLVKLTDTQGLEVVAELWAESPARSLPGALWRLYALRAATKHNPEQISLYFREGKDAAQVSHVIAGVAEPPGAEELTTMTDAILSGAFDGEFDIALERTAAFCQVIALGQVRIAERDKSIDPAHSLKLEDNSQRLEKTAQDLIYCARAWRHNELD